MNLLVISLSSHGQFICEIDSETTKESSLIKTLEITDKLKLKVEGNELAVDGWVLGPNNIIFNNKNEFKAEYRKGIVYQTHNLIMIDKQKSNGVVKFLKREHDSITLDVVEKNLQINLKNCQEVNQK